MGQIDKKRLLCYAHFFRLGPIDAVFLSKGGNMQETLFLYLSTWFFNILYWIAFIPQIYLNFKLKSAKGISDFMLIALFNGYITYSYFVICLDLPIAYQILSPISLITTIVLIVQRFMYDNGYKKDKGLLIFYGLNTILSILILPFAFSHTDFVGNITGWISSAIWVIYTLPQMVKMYLEKTAAGFSFLFVALVGIGDLSQTAIAIAYNLPVQSIFNGVRGVIAFIIFYILFTLYKEG
jgi:uncharacterized protein with PQ loop repeat